MSKIIDGDASYKEGAEKKGVNKILSQFIANDAKCIGTYVWLDVLVPSIKRAISEATKGSIDMLLYGSSTPPQTSNVRKINYSGSFITDRGTTEVEVVDTRNSAKDFGLIYLNTKEDVYVIIRQAEACIQKYGVVRVSDLYDWAGITTDNYMADKHGWKSLSRARVLKMPTGEWALKMPNPMPLD